MGKTKEEIRKIYCLERPDSLTIRDIFSGTKPAEGEIVSVIHDQEFLGYGKIANVRKDAKLNGYRHDVKILE